MFLTVKMKLWIKCRKTVENWLYCRKRAVFCE